MRKIGFSYEWISWITSLYNKAKTSMVVNGGKGETFTMEMVVRQGCPLTPYLNICL